MGDAPSTFARRVGTDEIPTWLADEIVPQVADA